MDTLEISRRLLGHELPGRFPDSTESGCWAILHHHENHPGGFTVPGLGHVTVVDHANTTDQSTNPGMYLVVYIEFADGQSASFYRINGYWDSWDCVWDGVLFPVSRRIETVTSYQPIEPPEWQ